MISGVILAAGMGSRFGGTKQLLHLGGKPLVQHVVDASVAAGLDEIVVVLGHDAERVREGIRLPRIARTVDNRDYDDGLSGTEGTFLICTFWLADNFVKLGEIDRAQELFERARDCANDLGLLGEQFDAETGEILGNFPQAFSHLGLINTAVQLERAARGETTERAAGPH